MTELVDQENGQEGDRKGKAGPNAAWISKGVGTDLKRTCHGRGDERQDEQDDVDERDAWRLLRFERPFPWRDDIRIETWIETETSHASRCSQTTVTGVPGPAANLAAALPLRTAISSEPQLPTI